MATIASLTDDDACPFRSWPIFAGREQYILDFVFIHIVVVDMRLIRSRVNIEPNLHGRHTSPVMDHRQRTPETLTVCIETISVNHQRHKFDTVIGVGTSGQELMIYQLGWYTFTSRYVQKVKTGSRG